MFERFPYTNFHDLNLDWILQVIKEFRESYPDIIEELNKKLDKPLFDSEGNLNEVLASNGDGTTKWMNIADQYTSIIYDAVFEWLDDHPEATTTVQDASLTIQKFTSPLKYMTKRNQSGCVAPVYIGDFLVNSVYVPSSVCVRNDTVVVLNAPTREYAIEQESGNGHVYSFSLNSNARLTDQVVNIGHGNSIAYDGEYYYVAPIWEYSDQGETDTSYIYKFSTSFVLQEQIGCPQPVNGVSYDSVTGALYAYAGGKIFKYAHGQFSLYSTIADYDSITENIMNDYLFNQDFAVHDNQFYISSPHGNILHGYIQETSSAVTDSFYIMLTDNTDRFLLGELEGFEFTGEHLYAVMYSDIPDNTRNGFVVEIPVNQVNCTSNPMKGLYNSANGTLILSSANQSKFSLEAYEIRTLNQLHTRKNVDNYTGVRIPESDTVVDDYEIRIAQSISIELNGSYQCKKFQLYRGMLNIYVNNENNLLTLTMDTFLFNIHRSSMIMINGPYTLNVNCPNIESGANNNFIGYAYNDSIVMIKQAVTESHGYTLMVGGSQLITDEIYYDSNRIIHTNHSIIFEGIEGLATNGATEIYLYLHSPKELPSTFTVTGTVILRCSEGYVDGNSDGISLTDSTNYTITHTRQNKFTARIKIMKSDSSAFSNVTNNSPVYSGLTSVTLTEA